MPISSFARVSNLVAVGFVGIGFIAAIVIVIVGRREVKGAGRYATPIALVVVLLVLAVNFRTLLTHPVTILLGAVVDFITARLFVGAAIVLARREGLNPFPLLSRFWGWPPATPIRVAPAQTGTGVAAAEPAVVDPPEVPPGAGAPGELGPGEPSVAQGGDGGSAVRRGRIRAWLLVAAACVAVNVYSLVLFRAAGAKPSEMAKRVLMSREERASYDLAQEQGQSWRPRVSPAAALLFTYLAVREELIFRLFGLTWLMRVLRRLAGRRFLSVLVVSVIWTLGHAGVVEPAWVKVAQIMAIGLVLGYMYLRTGFEGSVVIHASLNLVTPWLIRF